MGQEADYRRAWRNLKDDETVLFPDCFHGYLMIHVSKLQNYMLKAVNFSLYINYTLTL